MGRELGNCGSREVCLERMRKVAGMLDLGREKEEGRDLGTGLVDLGAGKEARKGRRRSRKVAVVVDLRVGGTELAVHSACAAKGYKPMGYVGI
ncbi:hypothetical protein ACH5RR_001350 [Cinchona calisaya]|uniref:Uncharacterized protein n=1 Tax=Cinchona calisaya TaxID=153742 RepID=A0ABD3B3G2_9GENT